MLTAVRLPVGTEVSMINEISTDDPAQLRVWGTIIIHIIIIIIIIIHVLMIWPPKMMRNQRSWSNICGKFTKLVRLAMREIFDCNKTENLITDNP